MSRQRSKPGAVLGWKLDPQIPASAVPISVNGKLMFWSGATKEVFFAEACVVEEIVVSPVTPAPPPPTP